MPIITVSNVSYGHGREVAESVAEKLGYEFFSRDNLREDASTQFNLPEIKLARSLESPPSLLDRLTGGTKEYVSYIRSVFFRRLLKDNIVYLGFVGQFLVKDIPNVLRVLVTTNLEDRIKTLKDRDGIGTGKAQKHIVKIDAARTKWSEHLYGIDNLDPDYYDLVLRIENMAIDDVATTIATATRLPCFQLSHASRSCLRDKVLAADVEVSLFEKFPSAKVFSTKDGKAQITVETAFEDRERVSAELEKVLLRIDGLTHFDIIFKTRSRMTRWE